MFENSRSLKFVLGAVVGLNLVVGAAVAVGALPHGGSDAGAELQAAAATLNVVEDTVPEPSPAEVPADTTTAPPETTVPAAAPTTAARRAITTAPPPVPTPAPMAPAPPTTDAPAPTAPVTTVSTLPARPNPSSAQVMSAIQQFRAQIPLFSPTEAQARQFGDMVCDAFDAGKSYSQVKAEALAQVAQVPFITITSAQADFVLKTAVQLFCPAYNAKLP